MMIGVTFFSLIIGSLLESFEDLKNLSSDNNEENSTNLQNWFTLLESFKKKENLPKTMVKNIEKHFFNYWEKDRLGIKGLPRAIRHTIVTKYLFEDIFFTKKVGCVEETHKMHF